MYYRIGENKMELDKVIKNRKSLRDFDLTRLVSKSKIDKIIQAATFAPTSCNLQLNKFILVQDKKMLRLLAKNVTGKINWTSQILVQVVDPKITYENNANYISAGMVTQNLMLKAYDLGIYTCPIAGFKNVNYLKEVLNIPKRLDVPLIIFIGYAKKGQEASFSPFKLPVRDLLSYGKFNFNDTFPTNTYMKNWSQYQVKSYRERIFPVYYPRYRHGMFENAFDSKYEEIFENSNNCNVLLFFPWEKNILDLHKKKYNNKFNLFAADILDKYLSFLSDNRKEHLKGISVVNDDMKFERQKYDRMILFNKLFFQKNLDIIFQQVDSELKAEGVFYLSIFSRFSLFGFIFGFLRFFGFNKDIYHKSFFYRVGPYHLFSKKTIYKLCEKNNLRVDKKYRFKTKVVEKNISKHLKFFARFVNNILPESILFEIKKK